MQNGTKMGMGKSQWVPLLELQRVPSHKHIWRFTGTKRAEIAAFLAALPPSLRTATESQQRCTRIPLAAHRSGARETNRQQGSCVSVAEPSQSEIEAACRESEAL